MAEPHKRLLAKINVPLIETLQKHFGIQDELLVKHLTEGFPMSGEMPEDIDGAREEEWDQGMSKEEVLEEASVYNARMLEKVKENEWSKDVHDQQWADYEEGFSSKPENLNNLWGTNVHDRSLISRGIAVREFREGRGERTRTVFHYTESMITSSRARKKRSTILSTSWRGG